MKKQFITFALGCVLGIFIHNYVLNSNGVGENAIKDLQLKNDSLLNANLKLDSLNEKLHDKVNEETYQIEVLSSKDENLKLKVDQLNTKLKSLNSNYEKANSHSNNFNSNEISRYFSNLR